MSRKSSRTRLRQHTNPLSARNLTPRGPVVLPADDVEVEVELGCGDARFLIERARAAPGRHHVGLDLREAFLDIGRDSDDASDLQNLQLEACNLSIDTPTLFAPGRIARFFILFADPWFKRRQKNRRWFDADTLDALVTALRSGGEIYFSSDVWDLVVDAFGVLEGHPRLHNVAGEWTFARENPFGAKSSREVSCDRDDKPYWRLHFRLSA